MTDYLSAAVDGLVPEFAEEQGDWPAVVRDAGVRQLAAAGKNHRSEVSGGGTHRRTRRRRVVVPAIVAAAIALPLVAVAASQSWWFFRFEGSPTPITDVKVVKSGTWSGQDWRLVAYLSSTDGICFGITPAGSEAEGRGAGMSCAAIEGVPRTSESKPYTPLAITFGSGSSERFPTYIVGPVIVVATEVVIHLADGTVVRTPTFDAPDELGRIRFYATPLPDVPRTMERPPLTQIRKIVGFDRGGEVVACLTVPMPEGGVTVEACR